VLTAESSHHAQSLAPAPGVTPPPADTEPQRFLSDVIIARRLVEPAAMRAALQASLAGRSLTEILVGNGSLSEDDLARTLAEHHRLDHVDLERFAVDREATALIEPDVARRLGAVPIAFLPAGAVVVALYDPNGSTAVPELARLTNRRIQPALASRSQIEALIGSLRRSDRVAFAPPRPVAAPAAAPAAPPASQPAPSPPAAPQAGGSLTIAVSGQLEATDERRRQAEERAAAAEERAQAAEELALAAETRATQAVHAANEALTRLLKACDALEGQGAQVEDLASRVAQLERTRRPTTQAPEPAPVSTFAPDPGAVEPSIVVPPPAPDAPPAIEGVREAAPAPAQAPAGQPAQPVRDTPRGLRRLVTHKGGG